MLTLTQAADMTGALAGTRRAAAWARASRAESFSTAPTSSASSA
jgi:hypothetical protein